MKALAEDGQGEPHNFESERHGARTPVNSGNNVKTAAVAVVGRGARPVGADVDYGVGRWWSRRKTRLAFGAGYSITR